MSAITLCSRSSVAETLSVTGRKERPIARRMRSETIALSRKMLLRSEESSPGMILKGTVRNVIDFGAFVDIGVHQDGLVHVSKLTNKKFVKHPLEVVSVGDVVEVKVLSVDLQKKRIQLSMIL